MAGAADGVTLSAFLKVLFPEPKGLVTLVRAERGRAGELWFHDINASTLEDGRPIGQLYYCVSTCEPVGRRSRRPSRKHPVLAYVIVLDDVGTKVPIDRLPPGVRPTYAIETSPSNFQLGFRLKDPVAPERAAALFDAIAKAGLTDPGSKDAVRLMRVPGSLNGKPKLEDFAARLTTWNPSLSYTYSELCTVLGVTPSDIGQRSSVPELAEGEQDHVAEWAVRHQGDVGGASGPPIRGLIPLLCPQHELHTVGVNRSNDSSTVWILGSPGAFKCTHGHCTSFTTREYLAWCRKTYAADPPPEHGQVTVDLNALGARLRAAVGGVSRETTLFAPSEGEDVREAVLGDLVKVGSVDRYYTIAGKEYLTRAGVDDHWYQRMNEAGLLDVDYEDAKGNPKTKVIAPHVWLRWQPDTMRVAKVVHRLGRPTMTEGDLNIAPSVPVRPAAAGEPSQWLDLVDHLAGGHGPTADALIDWLAMVVGCWDEKPGWHIILHGGQGTGKDLLTAPARWWLGLHHTRVEVAQIGGQFQDFLTSKLCTVDEIKMTTRGSTTLHDVYTTLKAWTVRGNDVVKINSKHLRQYTALDLSGWVLTSNETVPLPIDEDDRRFFVLEPPPKKSKRFYTDIVEWGEAGGWAQTIGWLCAQWDAMDEERRKAMRGDAPGTASKHRLIESSSEGIPGAVKLATRGSHGVGLPELITAQDMHDSLYGGTASILLPDAYRKQLSLPRVMLAMRQAGWVQLFKGRQVQHGTVRIRLWCRSAKRAELYEQMGAGKRLVETYQQMRSRPAGEVFDPLGSTTGSSGNIVDLHDDGGTLRDSSSRSGD